MKNSNDLPFPSEHSGEEAISPPELADLDFIRSEVNLLVFPFFALTTKGLRDLLETEFRITARRQGDTVELVWNVSANPKYGYPGPFDRELHRAVEQIISEILQRNGYVENPIPLGSIYSLCQRMGLEASSKGVFSGRLYQLIRQGLERIATTTIKSEGTFYHKGEQRWISRVFHLYDAVIFRGERLRDGRVAETNYLYLSDLYLESLNAYYIKPLDYCYVRSLRSLIAGRLYEILGVKFYGAQRRGAREVSFRYSTLTQLLPVERQRYKADAKKQLNPAHEELETTGFLAGYEWRDSGEKGDWLLIYRPGWRAAEEIREAEREWRRWAEGQEPLPGIMEELEQLSLPAGPCESSRTPLLVEELMRWGVSENSARELAEQRGELVEEWLAVIEYVEARNKAAFLVKALREGWQVPEEYRQKAAEQAAAAAAAAQARRAQARKEQEVRRQERQRAQAERAYEQLSGAQRAELEAAVWERLPEWLRRRIDQEELAQAPATAAIVDSMRQRVLQEWLAEGKLKEPKGRRSRRAEPQT